MKKIQNQSNKREPKPALLEFGGVTRRGFIKKISKTVLAGGLLVAGAELATGTVPGGFRCDKCNISRHTCGIEQCAGFDNCGYHTCTTSDQCYISFDCVSDSCSSNLCSAKDNCTFY